MPMLDQSHVLIAFSNYKNYVQQEREEGIILRRYGRKELGCRETNLTEKELGSFLKFSIKNKTGEIPRRSRILRLGLLY